VWNLRDGRLQISPGIRARMHRDAFHGTPAYASLPSGPRERSTAWDASAQIGTRLALTSTLSLKANLGRYTRVPTLLERFGMRAGLLGNPDLRPETGVNRDAGLVWQRPGEGRRFELTVFDNDQFDLIQHRRVSAGLVRAVNVGRAALRGVEADLDTGPLGPLRNQINVTVLSAVDRTDDQLAGGKQLPDRPSHEISYRLQLAAGPVMLGYDLDALGPRFAESGERTPVASRILHGLAATFRWEWMQWDLRVDNLADTASFDLWGYPLPGRTLTLSLSTGGPHAP
jgi:iron complex outermembrane receptor protein